MTPNEIENDLFFGSSDLIDKLVHRYKDIVVVHYERFVRGIESVTDNEIGTSIGISDKRHLKDEYRYLTKYFHDSNDVLSALKCAYNGIISWKTLLIIVMLMREAEVDRNNRFTKREIRDLDYYINCEFKALGYSLSGDCRIMDIEQIETDSIVLAA